MTGVVWAVAGAGMLVCVAVAALSDGEDVGAFALAGLLVGGVGLSLWRGTAAPPVPTTIQLFRAVVAGALAAILAAAAPYLLADAPSAVNDAFIEAISGVTTTGATVVPDPESLGRAVLLWRALTQWLGAAGVVLLVVFVYPYLGIGGVDPGGVVTRAGRRLAARTSGSLARLALAYVIITGAGAVAYLVAGMGAFDAVVHALTTASTGGFSTHAGSLAYFDSAAVEWAAIAGMLVAGTSFPLLWRVVVRREHTVLLRSFELRVYALIVLALTVAVLLGSAERAGYDADSVRGALFFSASAISTTGFTTGELLFLDEGSVALLVLAMGTGAMAASVAGGLKIVRLLAVAGYVRRELVRLVHPRAHGAIRVGRSTLSDEATGRMVGSVTLALGLIVVACLAVAATGADLTTSVSAVVAAFSTAGPALVEGQNTTYLTGLEPEARRVLAAMMVLGRIEVFPVLIVAGEALGRVAARLPRRRPRLLRAER